MSEKVGSILRGMGSKIKDIVAKFEDLVKKVEEVESKLEVGLETVKDEVKKEQDDGFQNLKDDILSAFSDEKKVILDEIQEIISHAKKEIADQVLDLSDLAEFDIDGDGIIEIDEFLLKGVSKFVTGNMEWGEFVAGLFVLAEKELGEQFKDKSKIVEWMNDKANEYDFPLAKWLHLWKAEQ
jgi:hypothetical protein